VIIELHGGDLAGHLDIIKLMPLLLTDSIGLACVKMYIRWWTIVGFARLRKALSTKQDVILLFHS